MEENFLKKLAEQPPLTADLLVRKIYTLLEENIISMTLLPESKLVEENIARALGVSRSPVREALMQLENAGLVVRRPGKGRVVASFTEREVIDNYEVWAMVESYTGGLACLTASKEDFEKIASVLDQMRRHAGAGTDDEVAAYRELNFNFHFNMVLPCPNKTLIRLYENALKPIKWCWNLSILWQSDSSLSFNEHEQLLNLYRKRERENYEKLVRRHIREASERFRTEYSRRMNNGEEAAAVSR